MIENIRCEITHTRLRIYVNDELWREGSIVILTRKPPLPEKGLLTDLTKIYSDLEYKGAKHYAYKLLARQNVSSFDLMRLLHAKSVSQEIAERVKDELQQLGYINDLTWAESFIRQQRQMKKGSQAIAYKLKNKGFSQEQIEGLLASQSEKDHDLKSIQTLLDTKFRSRNLKDYKEKCKVVNSLLRKGFVLDDVLKAILIFNL